MTGFSSFLIAVHCAHRKTQTYHHGLCDPCVVVGGISYHPVSFSCTNFLLERTKLMLIVGLSWIVSWSEFFSFWSPKQLAFCHPYISSASQSLDFLSSLHGDAAALSCDAVFICLTFFLFTFISVVFLCLLVYEWVNASAVIVLFMQCFQQCVWDSVELMSVQGPTYPCMNIMIASCLGVVLCSSLWLSINWRKIQKSLGKMNTSKETGQHLANLVYLNNSPVPDGKRRNWLSQRPWVLPDTETVFCYGCCCRPSAARKFVDEGIKTLEGK